MTEPPETAGKPNTVDCVDYIYQWALNAGYPANHPDYISQWGIEQGYAVDLTANWSIDELLLLISTGEKS